MRTRSCARRCIRVDFWPVTLPPHHAQRYKPAVPTPPTTGIAAGTARAWGPGVPRVYITGVGVVSSLGLGREEYFRALERGTSGISQVEAFDTSALGRSYAGEVKGFRPQDHLTAAHRNSLRAFPQGQF